MSEESNVALSVSGLRVAVGAGGPNLVDGISFAVERGECLGIVGESGSGKSLTLRSILGLLPRGVVVADGTISLARDGTLAALEPASLRGDGSVGMVFQEPMTALNPSMRVGKFLEKSVRMHRQVSRAEANTIAIDLLRELGVPDPEQRMHAWPHNLSGGLRQRVMIAAALSCQPSVLLCDEPTTALDVTIQDQILGVLDRIRTERGVALVFVTHDLAVVSQIAQRVAVMYAGRIMETGTVAQVFTRPEHPYTAGLLGAVPHLGSVTSRLVAIAGALPSPGSTPPGCRFSPRCAYADEACNSIDGHLRDVGEGRTTACIAPQRMKGSVS